MAAPGPEDPKTEPNAEWGLHLTPRESHDMKQDQGDKILFVDMREPTEKMFTSFTDMVGANEPCLPVNRS